MAKVFPFQPYRYSPKAGPLENLLTQPYDKITPEMQARYLALSPHNLVRVELGERTPADSETDNVYTRAARLIDDWIAGCILVREPEPALFAYFQEFACPETGERLTRKGFIGLGAVEEYSAGVVFRHERTHSGPKQDRMELLRHTRAHTGQIFMLYDDRYGEVDRILEDAARGPATADLTDEFGVVHKMWRIAGEDELGCIQQAMADQKLLIADGHHRYETALAFHHEHPGLADASRVMMTFVNLRSPGVRILATHRVVHGLAGFDRAAALARAASEFRIEEVGSVEALQARWRTPHPGLACIGLAVDAGVFLLEAPRPDGTLDVSLAEEKILARLLDVTEERKQQALRYVRGAGAAAEQVRCGDAQAAILLEPTPVEEVARIAFSGQVLPQKSTDFYPKLLSGLTIYRLEK